MDRQDIVATDFPEARKGYDRAAVDRRLAAIADAFEELERRASSGSLAESAGDKVTGILEVAERKANELEREARVRAKEIVDDAQQQAREQVERARGAVSRLASELGLESGGANEPAKPEAEVPGGPVIVPEPSPEPVPEPTVPTPEVDPTPVVVPEPEPPAEPEPSPEPVPIPSPDPPPAASVNGSDAGAKKLVAMKMVFDGASRAEVAEKLGIEESDMLLDDVFSRAKR